MRQVSHRPADVLDFPRVEPADDAITVGGATHISRHRSETHRLPATTPSLDCTLDGDEQLLRWENIPLTTDVRVELTPSLCTSVPIIFRVPREQTRWGRG